MTNLTLRLAPRRTALLEGHDNILDVLVRVQAPRQPAGLAVKRRPLNVALVIDRSGSMSGRPLHEAKRCARLVIDGLSAEDRAALVAYDHDVSTLMPMTKLGDREVFHRELDAVASGGNTNLHGGWLRGAELLAPHAGSDRFSRVILLSDGCANQGLVDIDAITAQCSELAAAGVTTSTYGLGSNFNEQLMIEMGRAGQGNHYYGQAAEDLMDPFREELDLMTALCARRLELRLDAAHGVRVEVLNDLASLEAGAWRLPDIAWNSEAWALVRLRLTKEQVAGLGGAGGKALLSASLRYATLEGESRSIEPQTLALPAVPAGAYEAVAEDPLAKRRADELEVARIQLKARRAAQHGDWAEVERLMAAAGNLGADNEWVSRILNELKSLARQRDSSLYSKEALYSSRRLSSRLSTHDESSSVPDDDVPSYLRRKPAQGRRDSDDPSDPR